MVEYLEIILLIIAIIVVFRQIHDRIKDIENQSKDIEDKLEATYKLLKELQPKGPVEIPARLDDEVVNVIMDVTKQDMEEYQVEKAEFQKRQRKLLKDMMSVDDGTQYEGTEYGGADKINKEQIQEILENIKYRKANRLT